MSRNVKKWEKFGHIVIRFAEMVWGPEPPQGLASQLLIRSFKEVKPVSSRSKRSNRSANVTSIISLSSFAANLCCGSCLSELKFK